MKHNSWIHNSRNRYYNKYGKVNKKMILSNNNIKIKFVRNPYSRAVSSYIHIMKTTLKKNFNNEDMSFYKFLLNLESRKYKCNIHYNLQTINLEKKKIFDHIIKIENLKEEIENLNKLNNKNLNYNFRSHHHIIKNDIDINVSNIPFSKIKKIPYYKNFYNEETKKLVDKLYKLDIIRYNYTFEEFLNYNP